MDDVDVYWSVEPLYVVQIALALICGAILGGERAVRNHTAGVRTIMLITAGSCLFMIIGRLLTEEMNWPDGQTRVDPARLPSNVIAGIGFLGAGPIVAHRGRVNGLTTAATIWVSAGIGLLIGTDRFALAMVVTACVAGVNLIVRPLSHWLHRMGTWRRTEVVCRRGELQAQLVITVLEQYTADVEAVERDAGEVCIRATYRVNQRQNHAMFSALDRIGDVTISEPRAV